MMCYKQNIRLLHTKLKIKNSFLPLHATLGLLHRISFYIFGPATCACLLCCCASSSCALHGQICGQNITAVCELERIIPNP